MKSHESREKVDCLLNGLALAYDRASWHGPNLRGALRGVDLPTACWRPDAQRHNIWEIVVHSAYWKYAARRRLTRETRGSFPLTGSNWFERPKQRDNTAWKTDLQLLDDQHYQLVTVVQELHDEDLESEIGKGLSVFRLVYGVTLHDVYHAGQIRLLRRLMQSSKHFS